MKSSPVTTRNAVIATANIWIQDHGLLTATLDLDYGDGGFQAFGGYNLSANFAGPFIRGILVALGVDDWKQIEGEPVRVKIIDDKVFSIGHIIKDTWFSPSITLVDKTISHIEAYENE